MKNILSIISLIFIASVAQAGIFNMVEINPRHGNCQDIYTDSAKYIYGAGGLKHFAELNGLLYFVGADEAHNEELWVTDGTQAGTHIVKDINPNTGSDIGDLRIVGNKILFLASETNTPTFNSNDYDLYVSDGTASGTVKVNELNAQYNTLLAEQSAGVANGKLIFCTNTDVMVSDGSAQGSKSLAQVNISAYIGNNGYCEMNGSVFFIVNNDIWKSDGTAAGTAVVKSFTSSTNPWSLQYVSYIKAFDGKLYIIGAKTGEGEDLYTFDGTEGGAVTKIFNLPQGSNSYPGSLMVCGNSLWFSASDTISTSIYKMSTSSSGPIKVGPALFSLSSANGKIYMQNASANGYDVIDAWTGARSSFSIRGITLSNLSLWGTANWLITVGNKTAFLAYDSATGQQELCITDGTDAGTHVEMPAGVTQPHPFDYIPGCGILDVFDLTSYNGQLVVPANFNNAGRELWFYKESGMAAGITENDLQSKITIYPNPANNDIMIDMKDAGTAAGLTIQIIDIKGSVISESDLMGDKGTINTSNLANGPYIVTVKSGTDMIARCRLTVVH